jgi:hypothetical protein
MYEGLYKYIWFDMFFYGGPNRVKDKVKLQQTFSVDPVYLRHENSDQATDFMVQTTYIFTFLVI